MDKKLLYNKKILIVNYGMGNIGSVCNALNYLEGQYLISNKKEDIKNADAFILPGVGAFSVAINNLKKLDLIELLTTEVIYKKKPILGICLGMQLFAKDSTEGSFSLGLGWIDGHVLEIEKKNNFRVPHVGWNDIRMNSNASMFTNIEADPHFYFDHSFHMACSEEIISATCEYGKPYSVALQKNNLWATQFHPEKSQRNGLILLRNFLNFVEEDEHYNVKK